MKTLELEIYLRGAWHTAAKLTFSEPEKGRYGAMQLEYMAALVAEFQHVPAALAALTIPLDFFSYRFERWPVFLLEMMPMGAARRYWCGRYQWQHMDSAEHDLFLLENHSQAPIGNLRIAPVTPKSPAVSGFSQQDVASRATGFLDYANSVGAAIGGATGAGGEAPKYLLQEDQRGNFYPEGCLSDEKVQHHWLVKYPRQSSAQQTSLVIDQIILEAEAAYYSIAAELGFSTLNHNLKYIAVDEHSGIYKPSLWLRRFDRLHLNDTATAARFGVESFYSLASIYEPGATVYHSVYLAQLKNLWQQWQQPDFASVVEEYLARDLLNILLGNTDNHGRNMALIKTDTGVALAPIYDLAPMALDPAGIIRTTRWSQTNELGGQFNWQGICEEAAQTTGVPASQLWQNLQKRAIKMQAIPELALKYQVPEVVLQHQTANLNLLATPDRLKHWGLI